MKVKIFVGRFFLISFIRRIIMCRKLIYLASFVLVLSLVSNASADLVAYWPLNEDAIDIAGNHHGTLV